ncbi:hypothetical protein EVAR_29603_1 [Eumeta japonica]|uniref:Uncharacterized protein n=1 Tax=Eumeta variegata TaxID=151549 RepID=A0A4C1VT68_EUMVA|nr:hypothetical protein EVAR_29603_1 [Eumeta japonica]
MSSESKSGPFEFCDDKHISQIEGKVGGGPHRMAGRRGDMLLNATTRFLLHGISGGDGRVAKSDTESEKG